MNNNLSNCIKIMIVVFAIFLQSCAYFNTYHNQDINNKPGTTSVDAKQRFLIYGYAPDSIEEKKIKTERITKGNPKGNKNTTTTTTTTDKRLVYCAEPSPDALSAFAASLNLSSDKAESLALALKGQFSESSATIGIRTQSIQLLRDAMYRNCEAYLAGAITKDHFADLQKSYQKSMVTLVAIEQLARAVAPGQVVINSKAERTPAQNIVELKKLLDAEIDEVTKLTQEENAAKEKLKTAQDTLKDKVKDADGNPPADFTAAQEICEKEEGKKLEPCKEYTDIEAEKNDLSKKLANSEKNKKTLQEQFDKASNDSGLLAEATANVIYNVKAAEQPQNVSDKVADTVKSLVSMVYMDEYIKICVGELYKINDQFNLVDNLTKEDIEEEKFNNARRQFGPQQLDLFSLTKSDVNRFEREKKKAIKSIGDDQKVLQDSCNKAIVAYANALTNNLGITGADSEDSS